MYPFLVKMEDPFTRLVIDSADELFEMLPPHKGKSRIEFTAKLEKGWADMIWGEIYGHTPTYGPRYLHESIVELFSKSWYSKDNIARFGFEGNRSTSHYSTNAYWGSIIIMITKDFKIKTDILKTPPPLDLKWHEQMWGYKLITQEEIDREVAELLEYVEKWFQDVLRKYHQRQIQSMKKDIVAQVWHPRRVAKYLEEGIILENV